MKELNFANGIKEYNYEKFGIYIPFMYYMKESLLKLCTAWSDETRLEYFDRRYIENRDMVSYSDGKGNVRETFNEYMSSLTFYDDVGEYSLNRIMMSLSDILTEISSDNNIKVGKYYIQHNRGFFGYRDDYEDLLEEEFKLYCDNELIFTTYNGRGFYDCIEKIIEHAGGFESYRMLID